MIDLGRFPTRNPEDSVLCPCERASYQAAHEILATDFSMRKYATQGARRTHTVDAIAEIIQKHFQVLKPRERTVQG